eukprot:CAMPEP_0174298848 /NCGR_PEP_ID=MMETSP0809-20121228/55000_1 /TAXON_ID=73025 ORGANISM="Eutreptiella gymnastica-like, Strain CCMP1594" /NCGR_SAMPLE_ID=MMETSP0809 /ASSEMBLY_ACC=CAM_ASM_000658 /LENGTH=131 /DNA_ID=CAMNT_0015403601 /DNA_START=165 /DNA_END=560 /DNA_ORIENTATION=-
MGMVCHTQGQVGCDTHGTGAHDNGLGGGAATTQGNTYYLQQPPQGCAVGCEKHCEGGSDTHGGGLHYVGGGCRHTWVGTNGKGGWLLYTLGECLLQSGCDPHVEVGCTHEVVVALREIDTKRMRDAVPAMG